MVQKRKANEFVPSIEYNPEYTMRGGGGSEIGTSISRHGRNYDMIYLLTAIGLSPVGRSTVHIYTQTIHRTIQKNQYIEQHNNFERVHAVPHLG
jgi:hypothetical protein